MDSNELFTVNEFAKFSRTTRDTLLYYDKIGILSPVSRAANNYRYYSCGQLSAVNMIRTLQEIGMTLNEIKSIKDNRTPALVDKLFARQIRTINKKIEDMIRARKLLLTLKKTIDSAINADEEEITIKFLPAEAIVLGDLNDFDAAVDGYAALPGFYNAISEKYPGLDLNYSVWGFFSGQRIKRGDWRCPDRYYFCNPEGLDARPAAMYAIGYSRGGYGQNDELYRRVIDYIHTNGFEICGDAYEEYPLNEICVANDKDYLIRVMITVREKKRIRI